MLEKAQEQAIDLAFHHGKVRRLTLHVVHSNAKAKKLYERFGFQVEKVESSVIMNYLISESKAYYMSMTV